MEPARPPRSPNPSKDDSQQQIRLPEVPVQKAIETIPSLIPSQSSHCHFLGCITIRPGNHNNGQAVALTLHHISTWLGRFFPMSALPSLSPGKLREADTCMFGDTHLSTIRYIPGSSPDTAPPIHALALEHTDRNLSGRRWRTELVLKETPAGNVKVYAGVYHGLRGGYIGPTLESPSPSTPSIVQHLLRDQRLDCYYDIVKSFETPLQVNDTREHGELFTRLLTHPARTTPLVLMNLRGTPDGAQFVWDPYSLTRGCVGSGTVIVPSSPLWIDGPFLSTLAEKLGPHGPRYVSGLQNGGVRVFQPKVLPERFDDSKRHRYFHHTNGPDVPRWIQEGLRNTLRASLDKTNQVFTFDGVQRAIAQDAENVRLQELQERVKAAIAPEGGIATEQERDNLKKLVLALQEELTKRQLESSELSGLKVKHSQMEEELDAAQQLLDSATQQIDDLQDKLDNEKSARFESEQQAAVYKTLLDGKQDAEESRKELAIPTRIPTDPYETVEFLSKALKPRVAILDTALASSRELPDSRLHDVWACLVQLHEVLWPLHFGEETEDAPEYKAHRIPALFTQKTGIDYTVNESSMTNKDSDLMRQRQITVDGKEFDFSAHLKVGSKPKDALRIHFAVDEDKKRILVWHCGGHLDTAGTRRRS